MHCINCYRELKPGIRFCPYCGAQQINRQPYRAGAGYGDDDAGSASGGSAAHAESTSAAGRQTAYAESTFGGDAAHTEGASGGSANSSTARKTGRKAKSAKRTVQNGQGVYAGRTKTPSAARYMVLSVISALCWAGLPFGVVSIAFSSKINTAVKDADTELAWEYARLSRLWMIAAFAVGILSWVIYLLWRF